MRLVADLARGLAESVRETWPTDDRETGVFLAGACWAFVVYVLLLVGVSWLTILAMGGRP